MKPVTEILDGHTMDVAPIIDIMTTLANTGQFHSQQPGEVSAAIAGTCREVLNLLTQAVPQESMMLLGQAAAESMSEEEKAAARQAIIDDREYYTSVDEDEEFLSSMSTVIDEEPSADTRATDQ